MSPLTCAALLVSYITTPAHNVCFVDMGAGDTHSLWRTSTQVLAHPASLAGCQVRLHSMSTTTAAVSAEELSFVGQETFGARLLAEEALLATQPVQLTLMSRSKSLDKFIHFV